MRLDLVQNKFSAGAAYDLVNALNSVDFQTFGSQTIQIFMSNNEK